MIKGMAGARRDAGDDPRLLVIARDLEGTRHEMACGRQAGRLADRAVLVPSPRVPTLPLSPRDIPDYDDIAQTFATWYRVKLEELPGIAIVTHSQGGLILQRFLAWMLNQGPGRELARIRTIVMLACPNGGSGYLGSIRRILGPSAIPRPPTWRFSTGRSLLQRLQHHAHQAERHRCSGVWLSWSELPPSRCGAAGRRHRAPLPPRRPPRPSRRAAAAPARAPQPQRCDIAAVITAPMSHRCGPGAAARGPGAGPLSRR